MGMYDEPVWEEPKDPTTSHRYSKVLTHVMERPGEWAKIGEYASPESAYQAVLSLRRRKYRIPHPNDEWEFVHEDRYAYARYQG